MGNEKKVASVSKYFHVELSSQTQIELIIE
jgi:hypothetical protein